MTTHRPNGVSWPGIIVAATLLSGSVAPAAAQVSSGVRVEDVGINAAIGLATATAWSLVRGGGITGGAWRGLVGGATMSIGRQVAASPFGGSGFIGREISAVGVSVIASTGTEHLRLSFPVGPLELEVVDGRAFDWRVNATYAVAAAVNSFSKTKRLDSSLSFSSGTFVFRDERATLHTANGEASGSEFFGSIKIARDAFDGSGGVPNVLYHENVHVLQGDYIAVAVANPIERAILGKTNLGRRVTRHIDLGLVALAFNGIANGIVPYASRPWEREAYALTPRRDY